MRQSTADAASAGVTQTSAPGAALTARVRRTAVLLILAPRRHKGGRHETGISRYRYRHPRQSDLGRVATLCRPGSPGAHGRAQAVHADRQATSWPGGRRKSRHRDYAYHQTPTLPARGRRETRCAYGLRGGARLSVRAYTHGDPPAHYCPRGRRQLPWPSAGYGHRGP